MDKFFVEERLPVIDPSVPAEIMHVEIEQLKKLHPGFERDKNTIANTKQSFPLENKFNQAIKRMIDISFSFVFIVCVLSWLIPLLAILIKLDSRGPVFFLQKRNKHSGKIFTCFKLRTMVLNNEADLLAACENDKRITRFGNFLRTHYLDELPQFINVLLGDMSIVGPRPHMLTDNFNFEKLVNNYSYRHKVRPGITGLAQVLGYSGPANNRKKIETRINMDIFYIQKWSPGMDVKILVRTFRIMTKWP